jgi:hypothetical protein
MRWQHFLHAWIPAFERVKKSNAAFAADEQPSFPRKRESIYPYGTSGYMDPRMRGDDGLALNLVCHSLLADFFTRSQAGMTLRGLGSFRRQPRR